ncbi:unnamed protein product [Caenorhabditis nigoni]
MYRNYKHYKDREIEDACISIRVKPEECSNDKECRLLHYKKCVEEFPEISVTIFERLSDRPELKKVWIEGKDATASQKAMAKEIVEPFCKPFLKTSKYSEGDKEHPGYTFCCEILDYCSFYVQTWFYIVCGAVGLLLLVGIAGAVFFFYRKRKGKL